MMVNQGMKRNIDKLVVEKKGSTNIQLPDNDSGSLISYSKIILQSWTRAEFRLHNPTRGH
jgi:hypothetical protein